MFGSKQKNKKSISLRLPTALSGHNALDWWKGLDLDIKRRTSRLILDAGDVRSFDASGLAVLVRILARCRVARVKALLVNAPSEFLDELQMIGFDVVIPSTGRSALAV